MGVPRLVPNVWLETMEKVARGSVLHEPVKYIVPTKLLAQSDSWEIKEQNLQDHKVEVLQDEEVEEVELVNRLECCTSPLERRLFHSQLVLTKLQDNDDESSHF